MIIELCISLAAGALVVMLLGSLCAHVAQHTAYIAAKIRGELEYMNGVAQLLTDITEASNDPQAWHCDDHRAQWQLTNGTMVTWTCSAGSVYRTMQGSRECIMRGVEECRIMPHFVNKQHVSSAKVFVWRAGRAYSYVRALSSFLTYVEK